MRLGLGPAPGRQQESDDRYPRSVRHRADRIDPERLLAWFQSSVARRWIWKVTNSAGRSGAKPTTMFTTPLSMSSWVIVSGPHFTKYASSGALPARAPWRNSDKRNQSIDCRTLAHSGSSFGLNTT